MSTKTILHLIFTPLKCTICFETILSAIYVRTRTEPWAVGVLFVYRRRSTRRTIWSRSKAINLCTNKNMNILFILPGSGGGGEKNENSNCKFRFVCRLRCKYVWTMYNNVQYNFEFFHNFTDFLCHAFSTQVVVYSFFVRITRYRVPSQNIKIIRERDQSVRSPVEALGLHFGQGLWP